MRKYTVDPIPPFRPRGLYVCDWEREEAHIFDTKQEAVIFARAWGRRCHVGWLSSTCDPHIGKDRKPTTAEAVGEIALGRYDGSGAGSEGWMRRVTDHRGEA